MGTHTNQMEPSQRLLLGLSLSFVVLAIVLAIRLWTLHPPSPAYWHDESLQDLAWGAALIFGATYRNDPRWRPFIGLGIFSLFLAVCCAYRWVAGS